MAYSLKITVFNNRDYEASFNLKDGDAPLDLTGCKLTFSIETADKVISHTSGTPSNKCVTINNDPLGMMTLSLPYAVLKTINNGTYNHDLILTGPDGKRRGVWTGSMVVKDGVTN